MAKYLLAGEQINWLAIFSLVTFFFLFSLMIYLAFAKNRQKMYDHMAELPLEDGTNLPNE